MTSKLNDLYNQLDDLQGLWSNGDAAPTQTEIFLNGVKSATGSAQRGIVTELKEIVPAILNTGDTSTYNAFIDTLFDVSGQANMKQSEPFLRSDSGNPEYQEACKSGNLALVTLSEIANGIEKTNQSEAIKLKTRLVLAIHPDKSEDKVKQNIEGRYKYKMA